MAIDLQSLSITKTINSIIAFFRSQENNSAWKDLTTGSEGLFLIRLLANVMTNISYRLVTARRENYLSTANLLSSNIGISVNLGYSVYRGRNLHARVNLTATEYINIPILSSIGQYNDEYSIIYLGKELPEGETSLTLNAGDTVEVEVAIGNTKTVTINPDTKAIKVFSLFTENISEDYILYKYYGTDEALLLETTERIKDMIEGKYLVRTNPWNSVDIMFLNNEQIKFYNPPSGNYSYDDETEITLKYIELSGDIPSIPFTNDMFNNFTYNYTISISNYVPFETVDNIKINAPIDHEVQNLIRSKFDYSKRVKEVIPNVKETSYYPITPTYTQVSYLKDDYSFLLDYEIDDLMDKVLIKENFFGTPLPDIVYPRRLATLLTIMLKTTNKYMNFDNIKEDIDNILATNYNVLMEQTFNVYQLERLLENSLPYVVYARVSFQVGSRTTDTQYQLGSIVENNDTYYLANNILESTGNNEPTITNDVWQQISDNLQNNKVSKTGIDLGVDILDRMNDSGLESPYVGIIWHVFKKVDNIENLKPWTSQTSFKLGDFVTISNQPNLMLKCVNMYKSSGATAPNTQDIEVGDFIIDGNLVWVCINYNDFSLTNPTTPEDQEANPESPENDWYHSWKANSYYKLGAQINLNNLAFQLISFAGFSSSNDITFEKASYNIVNTIPTQSPTDPNRYNLTLVVQDNVMNVFEVGDEISILTPSGVVTTCKILAMNTYLGTGGIQQFTNILTDTEYPNTGMETFITLLSNRKGTKDGTILWKVIDDIEQISYDWNVYNIFDYNLTLK